MSSNPTPADVPVSTPRFVQTSGPWVLFALLLATSATTAWGAWEHRDALVIGWQPDGRRSIYLWSMVACALLAVAWLARLPWRAVMGGAALLAAASAVGLGPLATVVLVVSGAAQLGLLLFAARHAGNFHPFLVFPVAIATGLAIFAGVLQLAAPYPVHYPLVYVALMSTPWLMIRRDTRAAWQQLRGVLVTPDAGRSDVWSAALWIIAGLGVTIRLLAALAPEAGLDALNTHLKMASMVARDHAWVPATTGFVWAWMPMAADWIYALGYMLGGESAARLLNFSADALVLVGGARLAATVAGPRAGALAAAIYSSVPMTYLVTSSAFIENLWSLWLLAAVALASALRGGSPAWRDYSALGLLLGAAMAGKVITVFWLPIFGLFMVEQLVRRGHRAAPLRLALIAMVAASAAVGAWPYLLAWLQTGNPVFPFMNSVFKSPLYHTLSSFDNPAFRQPLHWRMLYDATFDSPRFVEGSPGAFGLLWLAILPAGLLGALVRGGGWIRACVAATVIAVVGIFAFQTYLRYISPAWGAWAVLAAVGLTLLPKPGRPVAAAIVALGGLAGLALFSNSTWQYRALPPAGPVDPSAYRTWQDMMRPEAALVDRANDLRLRHVLWLGRGFYAGLQAKVTTNSWHQRTDWAGVADPDALASWLAVRDIDGIVFAADTDPCKTVFCAVMPELGEPELLSGPARLYVVRPGTMEGSRRTVPASDFSTERLKDPDLSKAEPAWEGNGRWDVAAGTMRVSVDQLFTQTVTVAPNRTYRYRVRAKCASDVVEFRLQINWAGDRPLAPSLEVRTCTADWQDHEMTVVAPPGATAAVVYAAGHLPGQFVDVDALSLRE